MQSLMVGVKIEEIRVISSSVVQREVLRASVDAVTDISKTLTSPKQLTDSICRSGGISG